MRRPSIFRASSCKRPSFRSVRSVPIGYPVNLANDFSGVTDSMSHNYNNVGDPEVPSLYKTHTKSQELEVVRFFKDTIFGAAECAEDLWGYVTQSGTEGNLQGLFLGREAYPDAIMYASEDSHYSIFKIAKLLRMELSVVKSSANGEMSYRDFERLLDRTRPAVVCANIGTTMKGAIDDTRTISDILTRAGVQFYVHADAALMGAVLPFIRLDDDRIVFANSVSISGHKFFGVPFPCGVFVCEKRFVRGDTIEYIESVDNTISGSRNGHSSVFLKHVIEKKGVSGLEADVSACVNNARYLLKSLPRDLNPWMNDDSITVVFDRPPSKIIEKWQLATQDGVSHVVVMPHVTKDVIDDFLEDICEACCVPLSQTPYVYAMAAHA